MTEIAENIIFKKDSGEKLDTLQKFVGFKIRQGGILTVNFRTPSKEMEDIKIFFNGLRDSEPLTYDIGNTGEVQCYFRGVAPLLQQTDDSGAEYSFLSVTLQEIQEEYEDDELPSCGCGLN